MPAPAGRRRTSAAPREEVPVWTLLEREEEQAAMRAASPGKAGAREGDGEKEQKTGAGANIITLVVGKKRAGKTSLIDRFINPNKEDAAPKPTVSLDYRFVRHQADVSGKKSIGHIYDCCNEDLVDVVLSSHPAAKAAAQQQQQQGEDGAAAAAQPPQKRSAQQTGTLAVVVLDGSDPHSMLSSLLHWTSQIRARVGRSSRPDLGDLEQFPDRSELKPFPVPLLVVIAKYDLMVARLDAEVRKLVIRGISGGQK